MNDSSRQDFPRTALASAVAAALLPGVAYGAAGRVDFAYGDVKGRDTAGQERRLSRGAQINQGDTIVTARGRAQIRFTDGARTSLLPNTEFKVETYEFEEEKPAEAKGFFSLLKGGLRTITGAIGKLRQDAYQVNTPVATIGIRGTEYLVVLGNSANLWVGAGAIVACNSGGCARYENGESGYVASATARPIHTDQKPDDTGAEVGANEVLVSEHVDGNGEPDVFSDSGALFEDGPFYAVAVSAGDGGEGVIGQSGAPPDTPVAATFTSGVVLASYTSPISSSRGTANFEGVTDGTVGWGRWFDGVIQSDLDIDGYGGGTRPYTLSGSESHHYAVGIPTAVLPSGTASFQLIGATAPTYAHSSGGSGTLTSASLNVDFDTSFVNINLGLTMGADSFSVTNALTSFSGSSFSYSGSAATTGTACSSGCSSYVEGFFAGEGASRAAIAYKLATDDGLINGAAGLANTGAGTPITPSL